MLKNWVRKLLCSKKIAENSYHIAYESDLVPPVSLMRTEGIDVLEEWFRWGEEWSMMLRVYGKIARNSSVLEIGCGLGRIAFRLRYVLVEGTYEGFDICAYKVEFLKEKFESAYPNFHFSWSNVHNSLYNPMGQIAAAEYQFPYADESFDIVFAASLFTHMRPDATANYIRESARVLKPGGHCLFSFFLLDYYRPEQVRSLGFDVPDFNFDHAYGDFGDEFATVVPENPDQMTAYRSSLVERFARDAAMEFVMPPLPGYWSGSEASWIGTQDMVVLTKRLTRAQL